MTPELASLYGMPAPAQPGNKVPLPAERLGVLTSAGFLAANSRDDNDPIFRGHAITGQLLCSRLPMPPAVPDPPSAGPPRVRLAQHRSDPTCSACHAQLDGVGMALERFDAIGAYRTRADFGPGYTDYPLTGEAEFGGFTPAKFTGAAELVDRLVASPALVPCLVRQVFRSSFGRGETPTDAPVLQELETTFRGSGHRYRQLVRALVESTAFRYRRDSLGGTP